MPIVFSSEAPADAHQLIQAHLARSVAVPTRTGARVLSGRARLSGGIQAWFLSLAEAEIEAGSLACATPALWRYLVFEDQVAVSEVHLIHDEDQTRISSVAYGPMTEGMVAALGAAEGLDAVKTRDFEARLLIVPSVILIALWLRTLDGGEDILIALPPSKVSWPHFQPIAPSVAASTLNVAAADLKAALEGAKDNCVGAGSDGGAPPQVDAEPTRAKPPVLLHLVDVELGGAREPAGRHELLPELMQTQAHTNWCWSAVATSVGMWLETGSWTQCDTASGCLERECCCEDHSCNTSGYLEDALAYTKSYVSHVREPASVEQLRAELDAGRPLCTRFTWKGGGAHVNAITGYQEGVSGGVTVWIQDSIFGTTAMPHADYPSCYYGGDAWTTSYYCAAHRGASGLSDASS